MAHTNKSHIVHVYGIKNAIISTEQGRTKRQSPREKKCITLLLRNMQAQKKDGIPVHLCGLLQEPAVGGKITQAAT